MNNPSFSVYSRQEQEISLTYQEVEKLRLRYAFARSYDCQLSGNVGQDYFTFQIYKHRLIFAVCDGVGMSYQSHIASKYLGNQLQDWLVKITASELSQEARLHDRLNETMVGWIAEIDKEIKSYPLPAEMPPLFRESLSETRDRFGSQSVFVAGCLDWKDPKDLKAAFLWAGNAFLKLEDEAGHEIEIPIDWDDSNRWSSKHGIQGKLGVWSLPRNKGITRITAFSDGLSDVSESIPNFSDHQLEEHFIHSLLSSKSDDVSFFDVLVPSFFVDQYPLIESLNDLGKPIDESRTLKWRKKSGVENYVVEFTQDWTFKKADRVAAYDEETAVVVLPESGKYYVRVSGYVDHKLVAVSQIIRIDRRRLPLAKPQFILDGSDDPKSQSIRWHEVAGAEYYMLRYAPETSDDGTKEPERILYIGRKPYYEGPRTVAQGGVIRVEAIGNDDHAISAERYLPPIRRQKSAVSSITPLFSKEEIINKELLQQTPPHPPIDTLDKSLHTPALMDIKKEPNLPNIKETEKSRPQLFEIKVNPPIPAKPVPTKPEYLPSLLLIKTELGEDAVNLNWNGFKVDHFQIELKRDGKGKVLGDRGEIKMAHFHFNRNELEPGFYTFRVRPIVNGYEGEWSNSVNTIVPHTVKIEEWKHSYKEGKLSIYKLQEYVYDKSERYRYECQLCNNDRFGADSQLFTIEHSSHIEFKIDLGHEQSLFYRIRRFHKHILGQWSNSQLIVLKKK